MLYPLFAMTAPLNCLACQVLALIVKVEWTTEGDRVVQVLSVADLNLVLDINVLFTFFVHLAHIRFRKLLKSVALFQLIISAKFITWSNWFT